MKNNAGFQTNALTRIHESTTNPRRIFDESELAELADGAKGRMASGGLRSDGNITITTS